MLRGQADVSGVVPMPVDRTDDASVVLPSTGETVTWFYVTSSAWASATGQAAGTIVWGKLLYDGVQNSNRGALGSFNNTSLSLGAATRFDALVSVPESVFSEIQFMSPTDQKARLAIYLTTNGYYAIDHRRGQLWGKAKATVADDTATYYYKTPVTGGSANVAVTSVVPGTAATNLGKAEDAAHTSGDVGVMSLGVRTDTPAAIATTTGDYSPFILDALTHMWMREGYAPQYEDGTNGVAATQNKPVAVSTYAWSLDQSAALEASTVTKAAAGVLRSVAGRIDATHASATYYFQVYNSASLPADGAVTFLRAPLKLVHVNGTDTNFSIDCTMNGIYASTGIVAALSTTEFTKTVSGAFLSMNILYK